ncbi:MAG: hypothetical protein J2P41_12965 [Blastocatellia bacterium]|nr:hypothetical protein [Blastocatellia bacterium]
MVISVSGRCSFCGKEAGEVFGLAGVISRPTRICTELSCSFCDLQESQVKKLIAGPLSYICDLCVGDAAALLSMHC